MEKNAEGDPLSSAEDRQWLGEALRSFAEGGRENPLQTLGGALAKIADGGAEGTIEALDVIEGLLENHPELARNLPNTEAVPPLLALMNHGDTEVVERAAEVLSGATAHNPNLQKAMRDEKAMDILLGMRDSRRSGRTPLSNPRVLGFLAALLRHDAEMETEFVERKGIEFLTSLLSDRTEANQGLSKAANLLRHLMHEGRVSRADVSESMMAEAVASLLGRRFRDEVQLGENSAALARELVTRYRLPLAKAGQLGPLKESVDARLEWLRQVREDAKAEEGEFWDSHAVEIEALSAADKILRMPLPRSAN